MLYFMKPLPEHEIDVSDWTPFIQNPWFRDHFMYFVYSFQGILVIVSMVLGIWQSPNFFMKVALFVCTYAIHESLHLIVIYKAGDISITHSGIFFWITSGAVLSKKRFFLFMSLPFLCLTVLPAIAGIFASGIVRDSVVYIAWINAIIAGSDVINSVLIIGKPRDTLFYRGYCKRTW